MKGFCFTVDDNIRFFQDLTEGEYGGIFCHPYLSVYKRLHEKYGVKVQLNLFYQTVDGAFDLSKMTERFKEEWRENAGWLKLSFHSKLENVSPYENSEYVEVYADCKAVQEQILRFAGEESLAKTTTVHFCQATTAGITALRDNGVKGLLGLYGTVNEPRNSYQSTTAQADCIRRGETAYQDGLAYAGIDIVLNCYKKGEIFEQLQGLTARSLIKVMIHEQYFYPNYALYQADFEEKLDAVFACLTGNGFKSVFFEERI